VAHGQKASISDVVSSRLRFAITTDPNWKHDGVRVAPGNSLDGNTPQTPGMDRKAGVTQ